MRKAFFCLLAFLFACLCGSLSHAQDAEAKPRPAVKHRGSITALLRDEQNRIISAGEDGFLGIWSNEAAIDRFQVSAGAVSGLVLRPGFSQAALVESDEFSGFSVSAWDYETKTRIFSLNVIDAVSFLNYSAAGKFLIIGFAGRRGIIFADSETGVISEPVPELTDSITFAATSRSERTMISYSTAGSLSYWDLETGAELQHFEALPNIRSPLLFGNNCYIGGFDPHGLVILDAISGVTLARNTTANGFLFIDNPGFIDSQGAAQLCCLSAAGGSSVILRMEINQTGRLNILNRINIPRSMSELRAASYAGNESIALGDKLGVLWLWNKSLKKLLYSDSPVSIIDIASSSEAIGFISAGGMLGFLPLDYSQLKQDAALVLEEAAAPSGSGAYTRISSDPAASGRAGTTGFLLWQQSRSIPMLRKLSGPPLAAGGSALFFEKLPLRSPIRTGAIFGGNILILDTQGTVSVLNQESGNVTFSHAASGAQDAAFVDSAIIILGRNAVTGHAPFLVVNTQTGETVPLPYPALLGLRVYRGLSGAIYGAVVNQAEGKIETSILLLNASSPANSEKLAEYSGEDSSFFMAEAGGNPLSNLGGGAAYMYRGTRTGSGHLTREKIPIERSSGFPLKAAEGGRRIIILDAEGGICWHDSRSGKLLAVFNLYKDEWVLKTEEQTLSGAVSIKRPGANR